MSQITSNRVGVQLEIARMLLLAFAPLLKVVRHLGGVGLVFFGILSSIVPLPGSVDALTVLLAVRDPSFWWYYWLAATLGAVIGGCIPYGIGRSGGEHLLARHPLWSQVERWTKRVHAWGFAVAAAALLPLPLPTMPILFAAGAVRYPRKRFLAALALGRTIRYLAVALLAATYGRRAIQMAAHKLIVAAVAVVVVACVALAGYAHQGRFQGVPPTATVTKAQREAITQAAKSETQSVATV